MKTQWKLFLTAIMFYTRIPVRDLDYSEDLLNRSTKYFTLIGWIVGGLGALVFYVCQYLFPVSISVILSMVSTILLTGAFHEDGFADSCDAFGGGWTRAKILEIMKDSRIGTYGSLGLILMLGTKYLSLTNVYVEQIPFVLFAGHALSRYAATGMIFFSDYARDDASSKTKPVGKSLSPGDNLMAFILGTIPLLLLSVNYSYWYLLLLGTIVPIIYFLKRYFEKWIGGFTGDALGATQQIAELVFYLGFLTISNFI